MEAWHARAIQVDTSVNPSAKRLHTIISEVGAPLDETRTKSIRGCGTLRRTIHRYTNQGLVYLCTIAPLIGSHSTLQHI